MSVSRTGVAEVGRTERSGNEIGTLYGHNMQATRLVLQVQFGFCTFIKCVDFLADCNEGFFVSQLLSRLLWEKSQTFIKTFWCRPQVYVCYMLISSRCLALKTRHTSSKLLHYLVVGSCQDCHTHTVSFSHIQETALRTFDSNKKSTHNGQDNFTVKVIAVHTDSIDYWLFRLIVQWAQFYFIFMILFIVLCQISSASFII